MATLPHKSNYKYVISPYLNAIGFESLQNNSFHPHTNISKYCRCTVSLSYKTIRSDKCTST